jgi:pyruvate kinase
MLKNTRPTRAEVSDIALAVWQGAGAIMLSGETAVSPHPVLCVQVMRQVAEAAARYHAKLGLG